MNQRHHWTSLVIALPLLLFAPGRSEAAVDDSELRREFADPPLRWQSRPLWFWNGKLDAERTKGMVAACKTAGYYGMGILPCKGMGVDFMSPEFLQHYQVAVDAAGRLGMKMCLYDEFWFPSGSAGGLLAKKHPEALSKRLDMLATDVTGPNEFTQAVPEGTLMGAVAMAAATQQRLDITGAIKDGTLRWSVPAGDWKVMIFTCVRDGATITLNNKVNHERWRAFIIPGSRCLNVATLRFLKKFYDQGGTVIATTRLPDRAAEFGADAEVRRLVAEIFGPIVPIQDTAPRVSASSIWAGYEPVKTVDGNAQTRWNAADGDQGAQWLEADLGSTQTVAGVVVNELFDRVRGYRIQTWDGTAWVDQAAGDRLGERKEITFASVATTKVRLFMEAVVSDSASIAEWTILSAAGRNLFEREPSACHRNAKGGKAWFLPLPSVAALKSVLTAALPDGDVVIGQDPKLSGGNLSYIHKVKDGQSIYFFANSSDAEVDTWVALRGKLAPEIWNPHDGKIGPAEVDHVVGQEETVTRVHVKLAPVRSLFLVAGDPEAIQ